jgi:hypothetical protein
VLVFGIIAAIATDGGYDNGYHTKYNYYGYSEGTEYYSDKDNSLGLTESQWISFWASIIFCVYALIFESLFNVTIGKLITCTYVRKEDELKRVGSWRILLRTLCRYIPFDGLSYLSERPIGWHDSLSGTIVVNSKHNYKTFYYSFSSKGFRRLSLIISIIIGIPTYGAGFILYWLIAKMILWIYQGFKEDKLK